MGRQWDEPTLIKLASGFEAQVGARRAPGFLPTLPREPQKAPLGRRKTPMTLEEARANWQRNR
jgi:hypothetical protein